MRGNLARAMLPAVVGAAGGRRAQRKRQGGGRRAQAKPIVTSMHGATVHRPAGCEKRELEGRVGASLRVRETRTFGPARVAPGGEGRRPPDVLGAMDTRASVAAERGYHHTRFTT